jgi:hypothetical protein
MIGKIWKKPKLKSEKFGKYRRNCEKIWKIWKKSRLNSEMKCKIWKKIVKWYGKYGRK